MMREGKLTTCELKSVLKETQNHLRIVVGSEVGEDASVIDFKENLCVISTDPITGVSKDIGKFAFHINCNDIVASGARPVALLVTLLAPTNSELSEIKEVMDQIYVEAVKYGVDIIGGHTEYTKAVNQMVLSCTAIGECRETDLTLSKGFCSGDAICVTKHLGIEWTLIKCLEDRERVLSLLTESELQGALSLIEKLTIIPEGKILKEFDISAMHDITEGGVIGALTEMFSGKKECFELNREAFPILDITKKLLTLYDVKIEEIISSGSLIFMAKESEFNRIQKVFSAEKICVTAIGKVL